MSLEDNVIEELKIKGYDVLYCKEFYEAYESEDYVIVKKDDVLLVARFSYCSCSGLYEETTNSVIGSLKPFTLEYYQELKDNSYIMKEDQETFLDSLEVCV